MRSRFSDNEYSDPMLELVSLRQTKTVEEFYEEFESLLNLLQLLDDYALNVFIDNLKPEISKSVRLFYPKTLTHAFNLAKQMESLLFQTLRKPYIPYKNPPNPTNPYNLQQPPPKSDLPPLLPTPRGSFLTPYQPKYSYPNNTTKIFSSKPDTSSIKHGKPTTRQERDERRKKGLCVTPRLEGSMRGNRRVSLNEPQLLETHPRTRKAFSTIARLKNGTLVLSLIKSNNGNLINQTKILSKIRQNLI